MIKPAIARPRPSNSGSLLMRESAICPQTMPATPMRKKPQQKSPTMLKISDNNASGSFFRRGTAIADPAVVVTGATALAGGVDVAGGVAAAVVTPGTLESGAQPAAPSYHPRSERLSVPAVSC